MTKFKSILLLLPLILSLFSITSCQRSCGEVWEDTKTCTRHVGRGFSSLGGKQGDSRQIRNRDDFCVQTEYDWQDDNYGYAQNDFIPLQDESGRSMVCMSEVRQPRDTPGEYGSAIPGIEAFRDPSQNSRYASVFKNIGFEYNSELVKGQNNLNTVHNIAEYLKKHPNVYIFVEGHCCEKGPEAYNLALGSRRSNSVRSLLIQEGVSPNNLFTISYGKERPLVAGTEDNALNRRVQFKVYER